MNRQPSCTGGIRQALRFAVAMMVALCSNLSWAASPYQSPIPFGWYPKDGRCGPYGTRAAVKNREQAVAIVKVLLEESRWEIEVIEELPGYFKVQLRDAGTGQQQVVIIDKSTGRVRPVN